MYSLSFDAVSANGFQMNPLSAHPPRTPRSSIISANTTVYASGANKEENDERPTDVEEEPDEGDETRQSEAKNRVRSEDVWREMLKSSNGRDKAFVR